MISRLQMNHKVANTQQRLPPSAITKQKMNYRAPQHLDKNGGVEDRVNVTHYDSDGAKDKAKSKRTFKSTVMRSLRSDRVFLPKSLHEITADTDTKAKKSTASRAAQYMRPLRCNYGNQRYVSQTSKNVDQKNKRIRKRNVIGSLRSILGPEDGYGRSNLAQEQPDKGLASGRVAFPDKTNSLEQTTDLRIEVTDSVSKPSSFSRRRAKDLNQIEHSKGSLTAILGRAEQLMSGSDHTPTAPAKQATSGKTFERKERPPESRKTPSTHRTTRLSRRYQETKDKSDDNRSSSASPTSSVNSEDGSSNDASSLVRSELKWKPASAADVSATSTGKKSSTLSIQKGLDANHGSDPLARSETTTDEKQTVKEKVRVMRNSKNRQFDETKLREEIRARLRKNQEKYEVLAATIHSNKGEVASDEGSSLLSAPTTVSHEEKKGSVTKSHTTPTLNTKAGKQSRLKSKSKMARSHIVRNRIPVTIQEDSVLGEPGDSQGRETRDKAQNTRRVPQRERRSSHARKKSSMKAKTPQSPKKAKASFYPRSPKNSPGRNRRRFRVLVPHPTECAGSRTNNPHGGLCMTFPTRNKNGERIVEETPADRRISIDRIQGLMLIQ